ncbi:SCO-spondin-like [Sander lucioperca]|uniref:SCO-spondin-like n=1 Tax=Sander lucioperca TaxID=283035 RepID=UPI001653AB9C|nr:SCO-spondin-like [Sander lucioperca]
MDLGLDCEAPFVYSACGAPCEKQCALQGQGDLCLGGMQNGSCVPSEECGCVHLQHHASGQPPTPVTVPQGATVTIGCSTWLFVPVTECRCGIPSGNGTLEFMPKEEFSMDCNTCVCENGTLVCTKLQCPVYEPWNPWSSCSASCGRGQMTRIRLCQDTEGGPSCDDTMQTENCDLPSCPGLTWNKY